MNIKRLRDIGCYRGRRHAVVCSDLCTVMLLMAEHMESSSISASTLVLAYLCSIPLCHKFFHNMLAWHNLLFNSERSRVSRRMHSEDVHALNAALCVICRDCRSMVNAPRQTRAPARAKQRPCLAKRSSRIRVTLFVVLHSHTCYTSSLYWHHQTVSFSTQRLL